MAMERELLRHLGKKPATIVYPFEKYESIEGSRAKVEIDISKCIGCGTCIYDCPAYALEMIGKGLNCDMKWFPGRCVFCGQCVESCPRSAIKQTVEYDLATTESVEASGLMSERYVEFKRSKKEEETGRLGRFEVYKDSRGEFRFRLRAPNNEIIVVGEAYTRKASCIKGIESVKKNAAIAEIEDQTVAKGGGE